MLHPTASLVVLGLLLAAAVYTDLRDRRVPNTLVLVVASTGLVARVFQAGVVAAGSGLAAALVVGLLLWRPWRKGRVGGGDLKLASAVAVWLGLEQLLVFVLGGALAGGLLSIGCYLASAPEARLRMRTNLVQAGLGSQLPAVKAGGGRVSVPYALAIAAGAAAAVGLERFGG